MKFSLICLSVLLSNVALGAVVADGGYSVDPDHAHVGFSVGHLGISNVQGQFRKFSGDMSFVSGGQTQVNFQIETASVDTNQKRRNTHIKSEDFFDVETFPVIQYTSTSIEYSAAGDLKSVTGDLNFHGVTKSVKFDVAVIGTGAFPEGVNRAGYVATTKINRSDFGVSAFQGVVGEEITVTVNIEVIKQ